MPEFLKVRLRHAYSGQTAPELEIVDRAKLERAIADPYGYRMHVLGAPASAQSIPWSLVKGRYR